MGDKISMADIFYMSPQVIDLVDVNRSANMINVHNTTITKSSGVLEVEYSEGVVAQWFSMKLEEFQEIEDREFLRKNNIKSVFCVSHHSNDYSLIKAHIKELLQEYGGWIGNDSKGFQPYYNIMDIDGFSYI